MDSELLEKKMRAAEFFSWPKGDTHFEHHGAFWDYQEKNRQAFQQAVRDEANWSQEPPMLTVDTIDTIIDIGAHAGSWTLPLSLIAKRVYAYEPIHWQTLARNVELSEQKNIEVRPNLLSNDHGDRTVWIRSDNSGDTGIDLGDGEGRQRMRMTARPLDSLSHLGHIQGIKIDVQGHELAVLEGAEQTIRQHTPVICCELNKGHTGAEQFLKALGYELRTRTGKDWIWQQK